MTVAGPLAFADEVLLSVYERLQEMDWSFDGAYTRGDTHGIHPYPAKFIPQIPRSLIAALYPQDGTAVMDPFCGSGTTLVEAALAGIPAVGVDLNPLACLISKVKVTPLRYSLANAAEAALARARQTGGAPPPIPAVDHWFALEVQLALAALVGSIDEESDVDVRAALRVALSSIMVRVSNQESDTRYAAIAKNVGAEDVYEQFLRASRALDQAIATAWPPLFERPKVAILNKDILQAVPDDIPWPVSLAVTSPPYPNAYEYWLYHKYRMYWLGMDPIKVREREIGARPHYFKKNPHTPADFERQMSSVFALLSKVQTPGGHACFQVGNSLIRGKVIDNSALLRRAAAQHGYHEAASMTRDIPLNRKSFNPTHARIRQENVLVFRLEK